MNIRKIICRRALIKTLVGVALMFASVTILVLGQPERFGYLETNFGLTMAIFYLCVIAGAILLPAYLICLLKYK